MALKRCPICGEKYSDTYRDCPFCEEEDALQDGVEIRRCAVENGVTLFSNLDTVRLVLDVLEEITNKVSTIDAK